MHESPAPSEGPAPEPERLLVLLLHAHLPECRRPDLRESLEETWLFEALTESYLPLLRTLDRLRHDGIFARLTLSLSPILLEQLRDDALLRRYDQWLARSERFARYDADRAEGALAEAAAWHEEFFREIGRMWEDRCRRDLVAALREHASEGRVELATTCATHAFLPAHQGDPAAVESQVRVGLATFEEIVGRRPAFFWLPECGYFPGLEETLGAAGVSAFGLESHGVTRARPPPAAGIRTPLRCPNGVLAFGRDNAAARQVWSATEGFPGHPDYREFHRDRVHGLPDPVLRESPESGAFRLPTGLKYWRVTGPGERKEVYHPKTARERARRHAEDFAGGLFTEPRPYGSAPELAFLPFDAELFGHWWFEGPLWLDALFRSLAATPSVTPATATEAAGRFERPPEGIPAPSSWGRRGDFSHWINRETDWIYPRLTEAGRRFQKLLQHRGAPPDDPLAARAVRQAARTLLLLQASDWPFMMASGTTASLAADQLNTLFSRFDRLCSDLEADRISSEHLEACERADPAFPDPDLRHFLAGGTPAAAPGRPYRGVKKR